MTPRAAFAFDRSEAALVVGLAKSGLASVEVLRARGVRLYATDEKPSGELADAIATCERAGATFVAPTDVAELAKTVRYAVLSPGVPLTASVARVLQQTEVPILSEVEVAFQLCAAPMIAITGTKGKSTTTALTAHLLRHAGRSVRMGGNIGNPLIREAVAARAEDWVVAEVSSFQLETTHRFHPRVAVLLNISADHLDRYASMEEYARAKYRIFAQQTHEDTFIGDLDDARVAALTPASRRLWFTLSARHDTAAMYLENDALMYLAAEAGASPTCIAQRSEIPLAGEHNVHNVMAAALAALATGVAPEALRAGIESFHALPHRLKMLAEIDGVRYVDDSKSTNPSSVVAALHAYDHPIVLIAGGRAKGSGFEEMGAAIRERAKALVLIGEASDAIAAESDGVPTVRATSLDEAIARARELSAPGDVVLLSPGCASFDMFRSAEDRGDRFEAGVMALREAPHA